jgi:hypothetical protein
MLGLGRRLVAGRDSPWQFFHCQLLRCNLFELPDSDAYGVSAALVGFNLSCALELYFCHGLRGHQKSGTVRGSVVQVCDFMMVPVCLKVISTFASDFNIDPTVRLQAGDQVALALFPCSRRVVSPGWTHRGRWMKFCYCRFRHW